MEYSIVTVNIIYYRPDYRHLLNHFLWQTLDIKPKYPRIEKFLLFWQREIDAVIKDIIICDSATFEPKYFRKDYVYRIQ